MSIRAKLILGYLSIVAALALAAYFSFTGVNNISDAFHSVHAETVPAIEALEGLRFSGLRIVSSVSEFGLIQAQHGGNGDKSAERQGSDEERLIKEGFSGYRHAFANYKVVSDAYFPEDRKILSDISVKGAELERTAAAVISLSRSGTGGRRLLAAKESFEQAEMAFLGAIDTALRHQKSELEARRQTVENAVYDTMTRMAMLGLLAAAAAFIIGGLLSHYISSRLLQLGQAAARIEAGDLGARIATPSGDELGRLARSFDRMAESLDRTTGRLNGVLQNMADMLAVTDTSGSIVMLNRALAETLGRSEKSLAGTPAAELFRDGRFAGAPGQGTGKRPAAIKDLETSLTGAYGREVPVLVSAAPLAGETGEFQGMIITMRDMTARKEIEARIMQADKIAAIGRLAAGIAHEINNPVGIILGFAQSIAKRAPQDDPLAAPLRTIEREALRCKNFVQGVLNFSRDSSSEELKEDDLNSAVKAAVPLVRAQCRTRGIELDLRLHDGLPKLPLHQASIQQVVLNLCNNAIDATPAGGAVTISTSEDKCEQGDCAVLKVSDTGSGMTAETKARIFEPFFTTKGPGKGTGLGLPLVYETVRRHGGRIDVSSEPGHGTLFTIYLPLPGAGAQPAPR